MRRLSIFILLAVATLPSWAAKRLTVAQLAQELVAATSGHKTDVEIARQIGAVELTERLSDATLDRLTRAFANGSPAAIALQLLADQSSFLQLPVAESPGNAPPDDATQQQQLLAARKFALETLPHLPNLLATRTTFSFDDSLQELKKGAWGERAGLHLTGTSTAEVSVRNERESVQLNETSASLRAQGGLVTWGEFGSTLFLILSDSAQGKTTWSHWEKSSAGLLAVYDYAVPKSASHYEIDTPVERNLAANGSSSRWGIRPADSPSAGTSKLQRTSPAYHGSLWLDPVTGAILRVSLVADLKGNTVLERGAILVEYGPVRIGDRTFICPVRSLALSSAPPNVNATFSGATTKWLNENLFSRYHLFASTSRILAEDTSAPPPTPTPTPAPIPTQISVAPGASGSPGAQSPPTPPVSSIPSAETTANESQPPSPAPAPIPQPQESPVPSTNAGTEIAAAGTRSESPASPSELTKPPIQPLAQPPTVPDGGNTLHVDVNSVLIPVIVRDSQGRSVDDLQKQNFQILDDGKPRAVSRFLVETRGTPQPPETSATPQPATPKPAPGQTALPDRVTVFLFDDMHMTYEDLAHVETAAKNTLSVALTGSNVAAVVSTSGKINSGLTRDPAKLSEALIALRPQGVYRSDSTECPKINYYQADLIVNKHNNDALQDAIKQVMTVCNPNLPFNLAQGVAETTARRVLTVGRQDVLATYSSTAEIVRRMAKLPGQHTMILVSSGLLPIEEEARTAESRLMNLAAQSNVSISALDARGLYTTSLTASEDMRNRDPIQVSDFRQSEMKAAEDSMGELAYGTGGDFFHNSNDLEAGFRKLEAEPETVYLLELPLGAVNPDGAYHHLTVKVDRDHVRVQARKGYTAPKAANGKKK